MTGLWKILLMIGLAVIGTKFLAPDLYDSGRDWVSDQIGSRTSDTTADIDENQTSLSRSENITTEEDEEDIVNTTDAVNETQEQLEEEEYGPYKDYGEYGEEGYPEFNKCGYADYGYPDYIGTTKEGLTCADTISFWQDSECRSSPPYNYQGEIVLGGSDPNLECCVNDGTCHWVGW